MYALKNLSREHDKACRKVVERELEKEMNGNTPKFLSKEHCYLSNKADFSIVLFRRLILSKD